MLTVQDVGGGGGPREVCVCECVSVSRCEDNLGNDGKVLSPQIFLLLENNNARIVLVSISHLIVLVLGVVLVKLLVLISLENVYKKS